MQEHPARAGSSLTAQRKQLVFAIPVDEDGREEMRYFTEEDDQGTSSHEEDIQEALSVIGAWSDLDWDQTIEELDRIRHGR